MLRSLWIVIFSFVFFSAIIGCYIPQDQFVVLRDVPESPSFVVIPANNYLNQVAFANEIEEVIISAGVKIIMFSQATKEVTREVAVEGEIQAIEGSQAARKSGKGKLIERYIESFEEIKTDYIVLTYAGSRQIRIIKRQTREILAILKAPRIFTNDPKVRQKQRQQFYDALEKMGIPVIRTRKQGGRTSRTTRNSP